jgi:3-oxoacyl-[acyl-carrier-protein] synthase-3
MIGIKNVGVYVPEKRIDNVGKAIIHNVEKEFIEKKIGISQLAVKSRSQTTSDLCMAAFNHLQDEQADLNKKTIDFLCVCTQNGDFKIPHTSAVLHSKLGLSTRCAVFDISLGCSGYPYSLVIAKNFMEANALKHGLLFTGDPYSLIIDENDKHTDMIFGDGATATYLTASPLFEIGKGAFLTQCDSYKYLIKERGKRLRMNGRAIFGFVMRNVPGNIDECLKLNLLAKKDIDLFIFHQASRYVVDNLALRLKIDGQKVPFNIQNIGNTVSSTIPILLKQYLSRPNIEKILMSGFGVGLSICSLYIQRSKNE